jgi:hypothetical protein
VFAFPPTFPTVLRTAMQVHVASVLRLSCYISDRKNLWVHVHGCARLGGGLGMRGTLNAFARARTKAYHARPNGERLLVLGAISGVILRARVGVNVLLCRGRARTHADNKI